MKQNLTLEALRELLERRDMHALRGVLAEEHPADLAELLEELDERYKTATAISAELQKTLDKRYETAKKLSKELYEELDKRYGTLTEISDDLQKELDAKYQPSIPVSETAPEAPAADTLWVDKKNLR